MQEVPYLGKKTNFFPDPHLVLMGDIIRPFPQAQGKIGLVGIPFDGGVVSHRRGARHAPDTVRRLLSDCSTYNLDLDVDLTGVPIVDCGDIEVVTGDYAETHRRTEEVMNALFRSGMVMCIIGGDHSLSGPCVKGLCRAMEGKRIGVIDFDTHHDTREGWGENAGLWVREIQEWSGNAVRGENIAQIGVHGFAYSKYYADAVKRSGVRVFKPADVRRTGIEKVMEEALARAADGTDAIYVSVDIDVADAPYAPGTNEAPHGGMMPWEIVEGVVLAARHPKTRALDVMEISPPLDINNITANLGVEVLMQFMGGYAQRT